MIVNYELQIVNYDEKRQDAGELVRIINWPVRDFKYRLNEAHEHSKLSSKYIYNIYGIDEYGNHILIGQGDYDEDEGGGFYFVNKPKEDN